MASHRSELCDELIAKCARIAVKAPDKYPDFLREIGASMDSDFARIEEILTELTSLLTKDIVELQRVGAMLAEAKRHYYAGDTTVGSKILWHIYNDEPVMKWR